MYIVSIWKPSKARNATHDAGGISFHEKRSNALDFDILQVHQYHPICFTYVHVHVHIQVQYSLSMQKVVPDNSIATVDFSATIL
jgi:hypothetical protein